MNALLTGNPQARIAKLAFTAGVGVFALATAFVAGIFAASEALASIVDHNTGPDDDDPIAQRIFPDAA